MIEFARCHGILSLDMKWENDLGLSIDTQTYNRAYQICFHTIEDNFMKWLQYQILTRGPPCPGSREAKDKFVTN